MISEQLPTQSSSTLAFNMLVWAYFLFYFFCGVLFYGQTKKLQFLLLQLGVGEVNLPAKVEAKIWERMS